MRAAELEVLFTANTAEVDKAEQDVKSAGKRIESKPIEAKVDADTKPALDGLEKVEDAAKRIVSADTVARVEADISQAEAQAKKIQADLDYLNSVKGELQVDADIQSAEGKLERVNRTLQGLESARATMEVDADTSSAEAALDGLADEAGDAGAAAGAEAGGGLMDGIVGALDSTPIVGAVVGIGALAAAGLVAAIHDGLQVEVRQDRLQALTGISEPEAAKLGRAAGEAYANVFGESIEANMDTARIAVQQGLIDPAATVRQSQQVIQALSGIADVMDEDVRPVTVAVTQLLKTGLVETADQAFDLLATGAREGVNAQEDLIDTFTEYPALFQRLGLSGEEALGLINQGLEGGARNSDLAADALKEFQIRATDGSTASADGFKMLGLNAAEMTAQIASGGEAARDGLDVVLDKLREIEDPVERNAAAVALFGTQAEDLGEALFNMDLSTAVEQLNGVEGAAQRMFDTLADNDATKMEEAKRNIEVAADGIKGALAAAFSEPLEDLATFVSENRGEVIGFLLEIANGGLNFGRAFIEGLAAGTEGIGEFVSGPLADLMAEIYKAGLAMDAITPGDQSGMYAWALESADGMRQFGEGTDAVAETMRTELIGSIDTAQGKLNEFGVPQVLQAEFHDATMAAAQSLDAVGFAADGSKLSLEGVDTASLSASKAGAQLEDQVKAAVVALDEEAAAGARTGESQESLTQKYKAGRAALVAQLRQMGLTEAQANDLADAYGAVPGKVDTAISSNAGPQKRLVGDLAYEVRNLPDGSTTITAIGLDWALSSAQQLDRTLNTINGKSVSASVVYKQYGQAAMAAGGVLEFMAAGGVRDLTPMASTAQMVPANTWRVVGDRGDVAEAFIPLDGSARSMAILAETMQRMGVGGVSDGGSPAPMVSRSFSAPVTIISRERVSERDVLRALRSRELLAL